MFRGDRMPDTPHLPSKILSLALRALRRFRGKRPPELAQALGLQMRSYEHFESGAGRLNVDRVMAFADATASDGFAILVAQWIGSPQFAVRCANNKLVTILIMALRDFDATAGDAIATLDAQTLIGAFEDALGRLRDEAQRRSAQDWLQDHAAKLPRKPGPS